MPIGHKISIKKKEEIKRLRRTGLTYDAIAKKVGVSRAVVFTYSYDIKLTEQQNLDNRRRCMILEIEEKPIIVTLCGSTKFKKEFIEALERETCAGKIVISVGFFEHVDSIKLIREDKARLDTLHKRKIDISDEILVINKDGYIGESTSNEIQYAKRLRKRVNYWEGKKNEN